MDILTKSLLLASRVLGRNRERGGEERRREGGEGGGRREEFGQVLMTGNEVKGMGEGCNHVMIRTLVLFIGLQTSSVN